MAADRWDIHSSVLSKALLAWSARVRPPPSVLLLVYVASQSSRFTLLIADTDLMLPNAFLTLPLLGLVIRYMFFADGWWFLKGVFISGVSIAVAYVWHAAYVMLRSPR